MARFHPYLEYTGDAHHDADLGHHYRGQDIAMDWELELIVKHHDPKGVPDQDEHVIVHLELLPDEKRHKLRRFYACGPHDFVRIVFEFAAELLEHDLAAAHFHDGTEELEPIANKIEPVLPSLDDRSVGVLGPKDGLQHQVSVIQQVVECLRELVDEKEQVLESCNVFLRHLPLHEEALAGAAKLAERKFRDALLEGTVCVYELEKLEHLARVSDPLGDLVRHFHARVDRHVATHRGLEKVSNGDDVLAEARNVRNDDALTLLCSLVRRVGESNY